jgi:hypothetical protein
MIRKNVVYFVSALFIGAAVSLDRFHFESAEAVAAVPGSCTGTASAPVGHCTPYGANAQLVDNCRCSGSSPATCLPKGSYYCTDQLGRKLAASQGAACVDNCIWVTLSTEDLDAVTTDPVVQQSEG